MDRSSPPGDDITSTLSVPPVGDITSTLSVPPVGDAVALAEAVNALLLDPERRRRMGANGRQRVLDEFHVEQMVDRTVKVYREALMATSEPNRSK